LIRDYLDKQATTGLTISYFVVIETVLLSDDSKLCGTTGLSGNTKNGAITEGDKEASWQHGCARWIQQWCSH